MEYTGKDMFFQVVRCSLTSHKVRESLGFFTNYGSAKKVFDVEMIKAEKKGTFLDLLTHYFSD